MNKITIAILGALAASSSISVASANENIYAGAKLGYTDLHSACSLNEPCDDDSFGGGLFAGYDFTDNIAAELGFDILGNFESNEGTGVEADGNISALSLTPKFTLPLSEKFDLYGKLGGAYMWYDDNNELVFTGGVGVAHQVSERIKAQFEYQRFEDFDDDTVANLDANYFSIGFAYLFGQESAPEPAPAPEPRPVEEPVVEEMAVEEPAAPMVKAHDKIILENNFATADSSVTAQTEAELASVIELLVTYPQAKAIIVGHTDSSGSEEFNEQLSQERARAIADYLIGEGVIEQQLTVSGEGETNPIASNDTADGRALNRRVEVTVPEFEYEVEQ